MKNDLVHHEDGHILTHHQPQAIEQDFGVLDAYAGGIVHEENRFDSLATISAGYKKPGDRHPTISRDGTMHLHDPEDRAPGLKEILAATNGKKLTITFPFDRVKDFVQARYMAYTATKLLAHGDETGITEITGTDKAPVHTLYKPGTPDFKRLLAICKVSVSVHFSLMDWDENGQPIMIFPDGFGTYRLRFTSRNSHRNIMGQLRRLAPLTGGRFAGIPFDLQLVNRNVALPNGDQRAVPVFTFTMNRPQGITFDAATFHRITSAGIQQASLLQLAPPPPETIETALLDAELYADMDAGIPSSDSGPLTVDVEYEPTPSPAGPNTGAQQPTDRDLRLLQTDFDYDTELNRFFAAVKGTPLDNDAARAEVLSRSFSGIDSLKEVLASGITAKEWDDFLGKLHFAAAEQKQREADREYSNYAGRLEPKQIDWLNDQLDRAIDLGVPLIRRLEFISFLVREPVRKNTDITIDHLHALKEMFYDTSASDRGRRRPDSEIQQLVDGFDKHLTSDDAFDAALNNTTPARPAINVGGQDVFPIDRYDTEGIDLS